MPKKSGGAARAPARRKTTAGEGARRSTLPREDELIGIGVIRKAHGVRGEASVELLTDRPERVTDLQGAILVSPDRKDLQPVTIESARLHGGRALLRFSGVDSPESVRQLYGWSVEIRQDQVRKLGADEYFLHDLIGLEVVDSSGAKLGTTIDAQEGAAGVLLTVRREDGKTFELPFAATICTDIDTLKKRIVADVPLGLIDLDSVSPVEEASESVPLRIDVITIFPRMFDAFLEEGILAQARDNGLLQIKVWDLREFTRDKHRSTDDEAYGGGGGMVMLAEPIFRCLDAIRGEGSGDPWVVLMTPQGSRFDHGAAQTLAGKENLVVICGRYEGIDERIRDAVVDQEISVGDFVVSGGEVPAMLVIDAVSRMVEGVVGDWNSVRGDSFYNGLLDFPHYTRPAELRGLKVPEVLLSGHAENIRKWRREQSLRATLKKRPDLLETADLDDEARQLLEKIRNEGSQ